MGVVGPVLTPSVVGFLELPPAVPAGVDPPVLPLAVVGALVEGPLAVGILTLLPGLVGSTVVGPLLLVGKVVFIPLAFGFFVLPAAVVGTTVEGDAVVGGSWVLTPAEVGGAVVTEIGFGFFVLPTAVVGPPVEGAAVVGVSLVVTPAEVGGAVVTPPTCGFLGLTPALVGVVVIIPPAVGVFGPPWVVNGRLEEGFFALPTDVMGGAEVGTAGVLDAAVEGPPVVVGPAEVVVCVFGPFVVECGEEVGTMVEPCLVVRLVRGKAVVRTAVVGALVDAPCVGPSSLSSH